MEPILDDFGVDTTQLSYASFGERFVAVLIDGIIITFFDYILKTLFGTDSDSSVLGLLIYSLVSVFYYAGMESSDAQATLGKQVMKIKVADLDGRRITLSQGVGRYFARILSAITLMIGYLMMLWDDRNQTLHDKLAQTVVIKSQRRW